MQGSGATKPPIAADSHLSHLRPTIAIVSLVFVVAIASELPELFNELFALKALSLPPIAPPFSFFYAPVIFSIIWFNTLFQDQPRPYACDGSGVLAGALLVSGLIIIELLHGFGKVEADFEVIFSIAWALLFLFALLSFDHLHEWKEIMLVAAAFFCSATSIAGILLPEGGLFDHGLAGLLIRNKPDWDGVNSHAYFAAAISLIALHRTLFKQVSASDKALWWIVVVINVTSVAASQSFGAAASLFFGILTLAIARITNWSGPNSAVMSAILIGGIAVAWIALHPRPILGPGFNPPLQQNGSSASEGASKLSVRINMAKKAAELFLERPLFGRGWGTTSAETIKGHSLHGVPQVIAASYGLIGLALLALALYFNLPKDLSFPLTVPLMVVLAVELSLRTFIPLWFAIVISALTATKTKRTQ